MTVGVSARYVCGDEERRAALSAAIAGGVAVNGIDHVEVIDRELLGTPAEASRQRLLLVQCFAPGLGGLTREHIRIDGGVRIAPVHVRWLSLLDDITPAAPAGIPPEERQFLATYRAGEIDRARILAIGTDVRGDFSTYRVSLVEPGEVTPLGGFDPRLAAVDLSFKVECPSDFDCNADVACAPPSLPAPEIDYLAKDYASFRRLMLDRLSAVIPAWQERNPADQGVMLVEVLAYVGDQLSYAQDAAATEAYLGTARQRISVRRHARLVDYRVSEGMNARAWVVFDVEPGSDADGVEVPASTVLLSRVPGRATAVDAADLVAARRAGAEAFETLTGVTVRSGLNRLELHTWSNRSCCLPIGATSATLAGSHPDLEPGRLVAFEEVVGARTGAEADADRTHRHVVRLTGVEIGVDMVEQRDVTEITWAEDDAIPFALCVSAETDADHGSRYLPAVAVARANVVAVDHGLSVSEELPEVPARACDFRPVLTLGVLVHAAPWAAADAVEPSAPASVFAAPVVADAMPAVTLDTPAGQVWRPQRDLLASGAFSEEFVAEIDNDGLAHLRFGDNVHGEQPASGTVFTARYRIGVAGAGNVGAEAIAHVVDGPRGIRTVRNPLPAFGGSAPESLEEVRRYAPQAFRTQERAVTADDYARAAERHPDVQRAAAQFRWTGSWQTAFVSIDRRGGRALDAAFVLGMRQHLDRFRLAGVDLEIRPPVFAPLEIRMRVCVEPGYARSAVALALRDAFSNRRLAGGTLGLFHPDNWTFGQSVYLSHLYERADAIAGVHAVAIEVFKRWARAATTELADGVIVIGAQEIARLDNDPSLREHGLIEFVLEGGL